MKNTKQFFLMFLLTVIILNTQAQIGSLLKKAKEKVTEKKTTTTPAATTPAVGNKTTNEVPENKNSNKQFEEGIFNFPDPTYGNSYSGIALNIYKIKERYGVLASLAHVKKVTEKGTFHFAKDYTELKELINDEHLANASIQFSSIPFTNGRGDGKTSFSSSSDHIYALLETKTGTIKEAFKISSDENVNLTLQYYLYSNDADKIVGNFQTSSYNFTLTPQMAKEKYIVIDVMPQKEKATLYRFGKDGFNSTFSDFAYLHKQEIFTKTGEYKVRLNIKTAITDEWGKAKENETIEADGFFDYNFAIKDAKAKLAEGQEVFVYMKENINNAPVAIPTQWTEKSAVPAMGYTQDKLVQMFRNHFDGKLSDFSLVKFHTKNSNGGWTIEKNDLGIPLYRYSAQWYTVFMSSKVGKSCFYQGFGLRQNYAGGGTYGDVFVDIAPYKYLKCEEMK